MKWIKFILSLIASIALFIMAGSIIPLMVGYSFMDILKAFLLILIATTSLGCIAWILAYLLGYRRDE